jgi:ATP adenylyltransferase
MARNSAAELIDFIRTRMRMSHIYQPVVIRSLLDSGNVATVRQLALDLLSADESQIRYYEDRIKKMPLPVLRRHGVISTDRDGVVRLNVDRMTFEQRAELRAACDQAIGDFLSRRGLATWDNRLLELEPVPESVRYEVLKRDGRCLLCGATPQNERLEVDHIKPRSKGGGNGADNLQTLCGRCNRGKSNRDDSDFR